MGASMEPIPTGVELTAGVCEYMSLSGYVRGKRYPNPLKDVGQGKHNNWASSDSGYIPPNTVNLLRRFDSIIVGIAEVAAVAAKTFEMDNPEHDGISDDEFIGIVREIAFRFGRAAISERRVAEHFRDSPDREVLDGKKGDENNNVDIRCENYITQVKLSGTVGPTATECGYRTDWDKPKATAASDGEERELIWVTNTGKIFKKVDGRVMDGWERLNG